MLLLLLLKAVGAVIAPTKLLGRLNVSTFGLLNTAPNYEKKLKPVLQLLFMLSVQKGVYIVVQLAL